VKLNAKVQLFGEVPAGQTKHRTGSYKQWKSRFLLDEVADGVCKNLYVDGDR
jgi:hypothetical protein